MTRGSEDAAAAAVYKVKDERNSRTWYARLEVLAFFCFSSTRTRAGLPTYGFTYVQRYCTSMIHVSKQTAWTESQVGRYPGRIFTLTITAMESSLVFLRGFEHPVTIFSKLNQGSAPTPLSLLGLERGARSWVK